ncbi:hypothetical protein BFR75_15920 [Acinetobacter pittii]|uniref:hypothetical protein n=1 Tax=Acinetobacter pittii TaxID=48296 RepID=UPI0008395DB5|nr:hypothetical protein [Acinetobacter pittii]OCY28965.1 hypothetical protein BFR75_15920 [Acinetobacter pittii]
MMELTNNITWSSESLFAKAQVYIEQMENHNPSDWQYGLWSAFSLELMLRSALAKISPLLLADTKNWRNLTYALGMQSTKIRFNAVSISTKEVLDRLNELLPSFTQEISGFCALHISRRNAELHSGEVAFSNIKTADWLPYYYQAMDVLLKSMAKNISDIFKDSSYCEYLINSLKDEAAKSVKKEVEAFARVWFCKTQDEQDNLKLQAITWATKQIGHRVECPACRTIALLHGSLFGSVNTAIDNDKNEVVQKQAMMPTSFECIACGLKISGYSKLAACGLGEVFNVTATFTISEYFNLYTEDDLEEAKAEIESLNYEPDFND